MTRRIANAASGLGSGRRPTAADRAAHEATLRRLFPENYARELRCPTPEEAWRAEQAFARASAAAECEDERCAW